MTWEKMYESCAGLFTATEQLNTDSWISSRIDLSHKYEELMTRYTSFMSLTKKGIDEMIKKDKTCKGLQEVK